MIGCSYYQYFSPHPSGQPSKERLKPSLHFTKLNECPPFPCGPHHAIISHLFALSFLKAMPGVKCRPNHIVVFAKMDDRMRLPARLEG
jgi:hypothetical protein